MKDRPGLEWPGWDGRSRERQVEHAPLERPQEIEVDGRVDDLDAHLWMACSEPADDVRQDAHSHALVCADAQVAAEAPSELFDIDPRGVEARHDRVEVAEEDPARLRRPERSAPLLTRDDLRPDDPLEACYLLADRRRRIPEEASGAFERPLVGDRAKSCEMPKLEADPLGHRIGPHCH